MDTQRRLAEFVSAGIEGTAVAVFDLLQVAQAQTDLPLVIIAKVSDQSLTIEGMADASGSGLKPGDTFDLADRLAADVAALRSPACVEDTRRDPHFVERASRWQAGAYLGVPIIFSDGTLYGVLEGSDPGPRPFTKAEVQLFKVLARGAANELERKRNLESVLEPDAPPWQRLAGIRIAFAIAATELSEEEALRLRGALREAAEQLTNQVSTAVDALARADTAPPGPGEEDWPANVDAVLARAPFLLPSVSGPRIRTHSNTGVMVDIETPVLERILAHLLIDAWRSSPPNSRLSVTGVRRGESVEIAVEDQSGLVPEELSPRVLHPSRGARLGAAAVEGLVADAGGSLRVVPAEDGRRFVLDFPVLRAVSDSAPIATVTALDHGRRRP